MVDQVIYEFPNQNSLTKPSNHPPEEKLPVSTLYFIEDQDSILDYLPSLFNESTTLNLYIENQESLSIFPSSPFQGLRGTLSSISTVCSTTNGTNHEASPEQTSQFDSFLK
jgi:hypothetical protein